MIQIERGRFYRYVLTLLVAAAATFAAPRAVRAQQIQIFNANVDTSTGHLTVKAGAALPAGVRAFLFATPITEVHIMSIVVRFSPTALTAKKYDETIRQLKNAGEWPPAGLDYHVCFGSDGNLKVSEIWNSRAQFEAFGERLMPILAGAGIQFTNPPDIFEVHNIIKS